mmetsp:Transcript_35104/g.99911  ORF Transcript_35104/g.99911 Transcript_35104/m.99911 type:complete len:219 (+) Transcript_35104:653-1309(+)
MFSQRHHRPRLAPALPLEVRVLDPAVVLLQLGPQVAEQLVDHLVVRPVLVAQVAAVRGIFLEGLWQTAVQGTLGRRLLHLPDLLELLRLRLGLQPGPRKRAPEEVEQRVAGGLQVVAPALCEVALRAGRCVAHRALEFVLLLHANVRAVLPIPLCQSEVNQVQVVPPFGDPAHEVVRLNVSVDHTLRVQGLNASQHLLCDKNCCLDRQLAAAVLQPLL